MILNAGAEHCLSFINSQLQGKEVKPTGTLASRHVRRAVTISRQAACGALIVANKLAEYLQRRSPDACPWTVFDRNLMETVLEDHNLPPRLARHMPEDRVSQIEDLLADVFEVHPTAEAVIQQTTETILKLARLGNVILIGRGSTVITAGLPNVLHVRLVAPLEQRIKHACEIYPEYNHTLASARRFCLKEDRGRQRYLKKYFNKDIEDPLLYHLVINTGRVDYDAAAKLIAEAVLNLPAPG